MKPFLIIAVSMICLACNNPTAKPTVEQKLDVNDSLLNKKYIYYLHGRIVEMQGRNAYSEEYGKYELDSILKALELENSVIIGEIRPDTTTVNYYAQKLSKTIDSLLNVGVNANNINIIGASKGAVIAAKVSTINESPINYILLGGNSNGLEKENKWSFHGRVLCIYDPSDTIAGKDYSYWLKLSPNITAFKEVKLNEHLGHGFLYRPLKSWIIPSKEWMLGKN